MSKEIVLTGKHWTEYQKSKTSGVFLTEEEKQRLQNPKPIDKNDATAICTREGWKQYQQEKERMLRANGQ